MIVIFHVSEKSIVAKGCKFSLYALKFIGISNFNRFPSNKSITEFNNNSMNSLLFMCRVKNYRVSYRHSTV
jgi:hypothetical protein